MTNALDLEALRRKYLNQVFDEIEIAVSADDMVAFALSCGEVAPRFIDPAHPDLQASPTLPTSFQPSRRMPQGFPKVAGLGMDAGKAVHCHRPIRPGVKLTGRTHMHDIYAKTGRSGRMLFFVKRMEVLDGEGVLLASADTSVVMREHPGE